MRTMLEVERWGQDKRDEHLQNARQYRIWKSSCPQSHVAGPILRALAGWMDLNKRVRHDGSEPLLDDVAASRRGRQDRDSRLAAHAVHGRSAEEYRWG